MVKVLIWFAVIIVAVILYSFMKAKTESDKLYEELMSKHFFSNSDDVSKSDVKEHLKGCG